MTKKDDRTKLTYIKNKKNNCGICVCLRDKAPKGTPENDIVSICTGEYDKHGPKHQMLLSVEEAKQIGEALISVGYIKECKKTFSGEKTK